MTQAQRNAWDWLSAADAVRHALAAYYGASRQVSSELDIDSRGTPTGASHFLLTMTRDLVARINAHALAAGVNKPECDDWAFALLPEGRLWPQRSRDWLSGCRGGTPAESAHGCAALDFPAVGPATVELPGGDVASAATGRDETTPADLFFACLPGQSLPPVAAGDHTTAALEAANHDNS